MGDTQHSWVTDNYTQGLINRKARQLVKGPSFTVSDFEDIEQELRLKVLVSLDEYDANKGHWNAFVTAVVERKVADLVRRRTAASRDTRKVRSANTSVDRNGEAAIEISNSFSDRAHDARLGCDLRPDTERRSMLADLAVTLDSLPPDLRELAEAMKTSSVSKIARRKNIPRTTLIEEVQKLRRRFDRAGLREYL